MSTKARASGVSRGLCTINMKMIVVHNANNKEQRLKYKTCNKYMLEYDSCTINIKMRVVHNYRTKNRAQKNKNYVDLPLRLGDYEGNTKARVSGMRRGLGAWRWQCVLW